MKKMRFQITAKDDDYESCKIIANIIIKELKKKGIPKPINRMYRDQGIPFRILIPFDEEVPEWENF
jgi:hypothetical protein